VIAWSSTSADCPFAINQWASEKQDWINGVEDLNKVGHYTWLIAPEYRYYGIAGVESPPNNTPFKRTWLGSASRITAALDEAGTDLAGDFEMPVHLAASDVGTPRLSPESATVGASITPVVTSPHADGRFQLKGNWSSADPTIAQVQSDGTIAALAEGTTTLELETASKTYTFSFTVRDKQITAVAPLAAVTTPAGTAPTLPQQVEVTYDDESTGLLPVTWDAIDANDYQGRDGGEFSVNGTVAGWDEPVSVQVTVTPANVTNVAPTSFQVTTESGTAPTLPATASVTWSNGEVIDEEITWNAIDPAMWQAREGGSFDVHGMVDSSSTKLTTTVTVTPASVTSVAPLPAVTTPIQLAPSLPKTAAVTWSNGDVTNEEITWDAIDSSAWDSIGTVTVSGSVAGTTVTLEVNVVDATITAVVPPADVTTDSGTEPVLPETVTVHMDNDTTAQAAVTWQPIDAASYSPRAGGSFTVSGSVAGWEDPVTITVQVRPATITSVSPTAMALTVASGTAPELPEVATATWSNGDTTDEAIEWPEIDPASYSPRAGGSFTVTGSVKGWEDSLLATVHVTPATVSSIAPVTITTDVGVAPQLPTSVAVTWSNDEVTNEPVVWDAVAPSSWEAAGEVQLAGTVSSIDQSVRATVIVSEVSAPAPDESETPTTPGLPPLSPGEEGEADLPRTGWDVSAFAFASIVLLGAGGTLLATRRRALR
ncbi:MAG: Ig-like domain-containing protein, partial [Bowdeniella nasicola]|nr:Ig-like domain-containing protein [Bowdeniella nasicola]